MFYTNKLYILDSIGYIKKWKSVEQLYTTSYILNLSSKPQGT